LLFLSYAIGLWFTLRTHAAVIWNNEVDEKSKQDHVPNVTQQTLPGGQHARLQRHSSTQNSADAFGTEIRDTQMYKRILGQSLKQVGLSPREEFSREHPVTEFNVSNGPTTTPHLPPPKTSSGESARSEMRVLGLTEAQNNSLVREVAEMAATAAAIAARDATKPPRRISNAGVNSAQKPHNIRTGVVVETEEATAEAHAGGGHDAPNWGRGKSAFILCVATVLYALIAEILVNTVDVVLKNVAIDEKFLGITLFALVPNTTEFLVCCLAPLILSLLTSKSERYIFRYERKYCTFYGNRIGLCSPSLPPSNSCIGVVQCHHKPMA